MGNTGIQCEAFAGTQVSRLTAAAQPELAGHHQGLNRKGVRVCGHHLARRPDTFQHLVEALGE